MKRNKILFLLPFAGLLLAGCSFEEVWGKVADSFKNIISIDDKKEEKPEKESKDDGNNQQGEGQQGQQGEGEGGGNQQGQGEGEGGGGQQGGGGSVEAGAYTFNFDTQEFTSTSGSKSGISFEGAKADGQNDPAYYSPELRLYVGNTLTISADATITAIVFNANTCDHGKADGGLKANPGSVSEITDGFKWTGSAKSVKFTCDPGRQVHINYFTVTIGEGGEGGQGQGEGGGGQTHQDSELLVTLKGIITPIACQMLNCEASELVWLDYDSDDEADIYYYDTANLTFVELCAYSEELAFDEAQALLASFLPEGSELDDEASFDMSEYGYAELWYKTGDYYYILTVQSGENDAGEEAVMCYFDIVLQSQGEAYAEYFAG